jgi:peptidoglycan/xylan/chitin deacetylase (PgdA/CDA1 family)
MEKKNIITAIISNALIITLVSALFLACGGDGKAETANAPYYRGNTEKPQVALMFNVYDGSQYVEEIIAIIKKYRVTCTFFVGGVWVEKNNALLCEMAEVAEIGNHGYLHLDPATLSSSRNAEEIKLCETLVYKVCGVKTDLFAPPYGSVSDDMLETCESLSYSVVMWSKDTIDWRDKDSDLIIKRATTDIENGDMILMHPTEQTVKALPAILDFYIQKNLAPVTVSEVINSYEGY